jgi:hypothetical protein
LYDWAEGPHLSAWLNVEVSIHNEDCCEVSLKVFLELQPGPAGLGVLAAELCPQLIHETVVRRGR